MKRKSEALGMTLSLLVTFGVLFFLLWLLTGCKTVGRITAGAATVIGVQDAGKPATLATGETKQEVTLPANSPVSVTRIEAVPATDKPPFQPAREVFAFTPTKPTQWQATTNTLQADTGTVDTTIAMHKINAAENRNLLWASLGAALLAGVAVWFKYPTPALICGAASAVFFLAWKLAELPSWFWVIGVAAVVAAIFLYIGHEKGEKTTTTSNVS